MISIEELDTKTVACEVKRSEPALTLDYGAKSEDYWDDSGCWNTSS